ncbi:Zinc finger, SWIM-type [Phytophthora cactorum]|nr:Zinc finger, SWIM-type [Phytophthora cactorum]
MGLIGHSADTSRSFAGAIQGNLNSVPRILAQKKEGDCVDWFQEIYLDERWSKWYTTSAILSILPSQNAIESHNGDIKTAGITMKKAKTGTFLNASIPGVLALVAQDTSDKTLNTATRVRFAKEFVRRFCQIYSERFVPCAGPLPSKMVTKAHLHVEKGSYYELKRTVKRKASRSYLFHASNYMSNRSEPSAEPVTKQRADRYRISLPMNCRYIRGKQGNLDKDDTVLDITTSYQALHEVEILYAGGRTSNFQVKLEPTMPLKTTAAIRTIYQCDCKAFRGTGWVCSHVIATMSLEKHFNLSEAVVIQTTTKASGGQREVKGPLHSPYQKKMTFTKPLL